MTASPKRLARSLFAISGGDDYGADFHYWVKKTRKGYYLFGVEEGEIGGPDDSVLDAVSGTVQLGGQYLNIETTIAEEELKAILEGSAILSSEEDEVRINDVECASSSVTDILAAYRKSQGG